MIFKKTTRMERETATVELMIRRYCRMQHNCDGEKLCKECEELLSYAKFRLAHCPFQEGKTTCGKCPIHCYKSIQRKRIQKVMRTVGPRLILTNPLIALQHMLDGIRKKPKKKNR
ncbi:MAG: nitrous oxide-stimulated promoter family protein [Candidatus Electrothrix sp. AR3]|nr:nitrous oxide-stimulated promoter family protein [Candidatus Electrothrix sp. AR3]